VTLVSHAEPERQIQNPVQPASPALENSAEGMALTLAQFEELALRNNPTIAQAHSNVSGARALLYQVGSYPNPTLGYSGSQIADEGTDQHVVFVEQEMVRGPKLALNQQVMRYAIEAQAAAIDSQTLRVLTDVRIKFFVALAAQEQVRLTEEFKTVVEQGAQIAERRTAEAEGSQTELLQAQIQLSEILLAREQAAVAFAAAIDDLKAVTGVPDLKSLTLAGDLKQNSGSIDWGLVSAELLATSPELHTARAKLQQACAQLQRERIQSIPNPTVQFGAGIDNSTNSGLINVEVSAPLAVYHCNQGNISAARASYERASQEIVRIELAIKSRLANVSREYDSALAAVRKYETEILDRSAKSLKLSEDVYSAREIGFLEVFLIRKTYFESNLGYIQALSQLAQARARIDGMLLEGGLDPTNALDADDANRERVFSQQ
jgi:cobalt-zinc-cadmium efflux system outer membrane protein